MAEPITGPHTVPTPPNMRDRQRLRRDQHAEHGGRRHDQQHHRVEAADRAGDRAAQRDRA